MGILWNWNPFTSAHIDLFLVLYVQNDFRILYTETKDCFFYIIKLQLKVFDMILIYLFKIIT